MQKFTLSFVLLFALSTGLMMAQTIVTDRPDQTESPFAVPAGALQIESGFGATFSGSGTAQSRQIVAPFSLFRVGLLQSLELRIVSQHESLRLTDTSYRGMSDMQIGGKVELLNKEDGNTQIGFLANLRVPSGTPNLRTSGTSLESRLIISHSWGNVGLGYNVGLLTHNERANDLLYTISLNVGLSDKLGVFLEPYGQYTGFNHWVANVDAGFTYLITPRWQADMSFGTGLDQEMNFLAFGLSALLGVE